MWCTDKSRVQTTPALAHSRQQWKSRSRMTAVFLLQLWELRNLSAAELRLPYFPYCRGRSQLPSCILRQTWQYLFTFCPLLCIKKAPIDTKGAFFYRLFHFTILYHRCDYFVKGFWKNSRKICNISFWQCFRALRRGRRSRKTKSRIRICNIISCAFRGRVCCLCKLCGA